MSDERKSPAPAAKSAKAKPAGVGSHYATDDSEAEELADKLNEGAGAIKVAKGGIGKLVVETSSAKGKGGKAKAASSKKAPAKRKAAKEASDDEASDEEAPSKKRQKQKTAVRRVGSSEPQRRDEQLHEKYLSHTVPQLKLFLNINNIGPPRGGRKSDLAWHCAYGEIMGAPKKLCLRCGHGKLKPNIKPEAFGIVECIKGVTKWKCGGYFDEETDRMAFCNKTYTNEDIQTGPFKGIGHVDKDDVEAAEEARKHAYEERLAIRAHKAETGESREGSPERDEEGHVKRRFEIAPRTAEYEAMMASAEESKGSGKKGTKKRSSKAKSAVKHESDEEGSDDEGSRGDDESAADDSSVNDPSLAAFVSDSVRPAAAAAAASSPKPATAAAVGSKKEPCKYGDKCFRTNEEHLAKFSHPAKSKKQ